MEPYIYPHPIAICTLADEALNAALQAAIADKPEWAGLIIAPLTTENIGIEQIIEFSLGQPQLRTLLLCGHDAEQAIGWRPGGTMLALQANGVSGSDNRVIDAPGKRPVLKNLTIEAIDHFRQHVTLVDAIGQTDVVTLLSQLETLATAANTTTSLTPFTGTIKRPIETIIASADDAIMSDTAGYVVISIQPNADNPLVAEHYTPQGDHARTITGKTAKAVYMALIEHNAVSRLDHAAYLGRELARAEAALVTGQAYVQDSSPETLEIPA